MLQTKSILSKKSVSTPLTILLTSTRGIKVLMHATTFKLTIYNKLLQEKVSNLLSSMDIQPKSMVGLTDPISPIMCISFNNHLYSHINENLLLFQNSDKLQVDMGRIFMLTVPLPLNQEIITGLLSPQLKKTLQWEGFKTMAFLPSIGTLYPHNK